MKRDWFSTLVIAIEIAIGLGAAAGVCGAFHSY
jgi:hypothetical protein